MRNGRERGPPGPIRAVPPPLLAAERGGDVSCVPSVGFGGVGGTSPAPRPRTAWRLPTEGEGSPAGLRVRAGTGIDTGAEGQFGSPAPPHAAGGSRWREAAGKKRGKQCQANPGGVCGAGFHFGFGWRADRSGPPSPAVPAAWHGRAAPAASAALRGLRSCGSQSRGCTPGTRPRAGARRWPNPAEDVWQGPGTAAVRRAGAESARSPRERRSPPAARETGSRCRALHGSLSLAAAVFPVPPRKRIQVEYCLCGRDKISRADGDGGRGEGYCSSARDE